MKYHVNDKDETRRCFAVIKCKYGSERHFDSVRQGMNYIEAKAKAENFTNTVSTLTRQAVISAAVYPKVESPAAADILEGEREDARLSGRIGQRKEVVAIDSKDFRILKAEHFTFFISKVESKTGWPVEHVVLGNPDILTEQLPRRDAIARGVICRSDQKHKAGMRDQYGLRYSVVEAVNSKTKENEQVLIIESISIPSNQQGKGLASEFIDEALKAFPNARIPETRSMTKEGKEFFARMQETRGNKFKGYIANDYSFDPDSEGIVNYRENPKDFEPFD